MRVVWECLEENPVRKDFSSHLQKKFSCIQGEVLDIESEWTMFRALIVEVATKSWSLKMVDVCHGGNPRTCWWTLVVREAVKTKKEAFQKMLENWTPDTAEMYRLAKRAKAVAVIEVKAQAWEEFGKTTENDYWMASKVFW